jgi:hypothetical protein
VSGERVATFGEFLAAYGPPGEPPYGTGEPARVPEQPVEPAPPNRWRAFTDDELEALWELVTNQAAGASEVDGVDHLTAEIENEQQLRRVPQ